MINDDNVGKKVLNVIKHSIFKVVQLSSFIVEMGENIANIENTKKEK